jgi:hypothetical protein
VSPSRSPPRRAASAAAKPRPSAMPPAATTGIGATASTTAGTSPIVPRVVPEWPPASRPCAMMMSAPASAACLACISVCTWQIVLQPASLMRPVNGVGSPNDSITAAGRASSAISSAAWLRSNAQRMNPMPTRALPASASSSLITFVLAYPDPIIPSPPAWVTAAASLPPAAEPIGARSIGWCSGLPA